MPAALPTVIMLLAITMSKLRLAHKTALLLGTPQVSIKLLILGCHLRVKPKRGCFASLSLLCTQEC